MAGAMIGIRSTLGATLITNPSLFRIFERARASEVTEIKLFLRFSI